MLMIHSKVGLVVTYVKRNFLCFIRRLTFIWSFLFHGYAYIHSISGSFVHIHSPHSHTDIYVPISLPLTILSPFLSSLLLPTVNWSRSWMRSSVAASCCHGKLSSTIAAASVAAPLSLSFSTPSVSAVTAATTSARPAGSTASGTKLGSAPPAKRAGKVRVCGFVCVTERGWSRYEVELGDMD